MGGTATFTGHGRVSDWSDSNNWAAVAGSTTGGVSLVSMDATMNGSFTAHALMLLGQETVTINGALATLSRGLCNSFMVCVRATAIFTPGSSLNDAGGIIVGAQSVGTLLARGVAGSPTMLRSVSAKIGQQTGGVGTVTIDDAIWHNSQNAYVGQVGQGTLNVIDDGQISVGTSLVLGDAVGASGHVSLASGARMWVGGDVKIGGGSVGVLGGTGTMSVGAGAMFATGGPLKITATGALSLSGGVVSVGDPTLGLQIWQGGSLSGYGTVGASAGGIDNAGVISASGGTLTINGAISGGGAIKIGAGSTLDLTNARIGVSGISFLGSGGTLDLAHGAAVTGAISGFGVGDTLVMAGVDQVSFDSGSGLLTLRDAGQVVDTLSLAGSYAGDAFVLHETAVGAMIGLHGS